MSVRMLNSVILMRSVIMLNSVIMHPVFLNAITECLFTDCHYVEGYYTKCLGANSRTSRCSAESNQHRFISTEKNKPFKKSKNAISIRHSLKMTGMAKKERWSGNSSKWQLIEVATHRSGNSSNALRRSLSLKNIYVAQLIERMATHRRPLRSGNSSNLL
jgi:hypothetical protein